MFTPLPTHFFLHPGELGGKALFRKFDSGPGLITPNSDRGYLQNGVQRQRALTMDRNALRLMPAPATFTRCLTRILRPYTQNTLAGSLRYNGRLLT